MGYVYQIYGFKYSQKGTIVTSGITYPTENEARLAGEREIARVRSSNPYLRTLKMRVVRTNKAPGDYRSENFINSLDRIMGF